MKKVILQKEHWVYVIETFSPTEAAAFCSNANGYYPSSAMAAFVKTAAESTLCRQVSVKYKRCEQNGFTTIKAIVFDGCTTLTASLEEEMQRIYKKLLGSASYKTPAIEYN